MALRLAIISLPALASAFEIIDHKQAQQFLKPTNVHHRFARANAHGEEYLKGADITRECEQETCDFEEILEYAENTFSGKRTEAALEWSNEYYDKKTKQCYDAEIVRCNRPTTKICVNNWNDHTCECNPGWTGPTCTQDVDECLVPDFCGTGNCTNTEGSFVCDCQPTETGPRCEEDLDECLDQSDQCVNGDCINRASAEEAKGYVCACEAGWEGEFCDLDIDECQNSPCPDERICLNSAGSYSCLCKHGRTGENCEEILDYCTLFNPCKAYPGSQCILEDNSYRCLCPESGCLRAVEVVGDGDGQGETSFEEPVPDTNFDEYVTYEENNEGAVDDYGNSTNEEDFVEPEVNYNPYGTNEYHPDYLDE